MNIKKKQQQQQQQQKVIQVANYTKTVNNWVVIVIAR